MDLLFYGFLLHKEELKYYRGSRFFWKSIANVPIWSMSYYMQCKSPSTSVFRERHLLQTSCQKCTASLLVY